MEKIILDESIFEQKLIKLIIDKGFEYINKSGILQKRKSHSETLLMDEFKKSILNINKDIKPNQLNEVIGQIKRVNQSSLIPSNKLAHELLINGIKVYDEEKKMTKTFRLIDFHNINNNSFIITNQFSMISNNINFHQQRPDVVIYLNGLPIIIFELKSPGKQSIDIISNAFQQIKNYQEYLTPLFVFNFFNVISNKHITRIGTITSNIDRYTFWRTNHKDKKYNSQIEEIIDNLFDKQTLLNLLNNYVLFTDETNPQKIISGYHQYYGVEDATKSVIKAVKGQDKKAGIFWHTQGTGKSFSMVMLAKNIIKNVPKVTIIIVTDRTDLDEQIFATFSKSQTFLNQNVTKMISIIDLKNKLLNKVQNGIFFSTVQKFDKTIKLLSNREDIVVMTDEAHRSHTNIESRIEINKQSFQVEEKFGNAAFLRKALPNATFIGFTGTPIEKEDFSTRNIFGNYVSKYLMSDATKDGFVVPINYESRQVKLHIDESYIKELDKPHAEIRKKILDESKIPSVVMRNINKRLQQMTNIIGDNDRISAISEDFIKHYNQRKNILKGKVMFVAYNRKIALKYYHEIIKQEPKFKKIIRVIITGSQYDKPEESKIIKTKEWRKKSAIDFKDANSNFKIAIVVDMWLTGFDVPSLDVLYLDKPIKMHNLMQTIARVNRVYTDNINKNLTKDAGLVVDYIGIWKKLREALAFYASNGDVLLEIQGDWVNIKECKNKIEEIIGKINNIILDNFYIDYKKIPNDKGYIYDIVEKIQQKIIKKDLEELFINFIKPLSKLFKSSISILPLNLRYLIQILILVKGQIITRELGKFELKFEIENLKNIMQDAIKYNKTISYDSIDNEKISLISIMNEIKEISLKENPDLEANKGHVLAKALIKEVEKINMIKAEKLSNKLGRLLNKYDNNFMTIEEFMEGIKQIAKEARAIDKEAERLGISKEEMAFYEIILQDDFSKSNYDKGKIKKIALEVFQKVKLNINESWIFNNGMKQKVRAEIFDSLIRNKYPPPTAKKLRSHLVSQLEQQIENNPRFFERKQNE